MTVKGTKLVGGVLLGGGAIAGTSILISGNSFNETTSPSEQGDSLEQDLQTKENGKALENSVPEGDQSEQHSESENPSLEALPNSSPSQAEQDDTADNKSTDYSTLEGKNQEPSWTKDNEICEKSGYQDSSIGSRFKQYLICDKNDPEWDKKLRHWQGNIKDDKHHPTSKFYIDKKTFTKKPNVAGVRNLQNRCKTAFQYTSWKQPTSSKSGVRMDFDSYWADVKHYCTKDLVPNIPNWYN